jgi:hypothetical protein
MADGSDTSKIDELLRKARVVAGRSGGTVTQDTTGSVIGDTVKNAKETVETLKAVKVTTEEAKGLIELVKQSAFVAWDFLNKLWPVRAYKLQRPWFRVA